MPLGEPGFGLEGQDLDVPWSDNRVVRWSDRGVTISPTHESVNDLFFKYLHTLTRSE
jgi:hypothetical protein